MGAFLGVGFCCSSLSAFPLVWHTTNTRAPWYGLQVHAIREKGFPTHTSKTLFICFFPSFILVCIFLGRKPFRRYSNKVLGKWASERERKNNFRPTFWHARIRGKCSKKGTKSRGKDLDKQFVRSTDLQRKISGVYFWFSFFWTLGHTSQNNMFWVLLRSFFSLPFFPLLSQNQQD